MTTQRPEHQQLTRGINSQCAAMLAASKAKMPKIGFEACTYLQQQKQQTISIMHAHRYTYAHAHARGRKPQRVLQQRAVISGPQTAVFINCCRLTVSDHALLPLSVTA